MREEHDEATGLRTRHCRCGFSETYEQTRVGRGAERAPHVLLLCQVDVSELCARLSPVEWSGLNYEYMFSYMYHIRFIGVVWSGLFAACFRLLPWYTAWRSLTEILKCKSRLLLVTSVHFALAYGLRGGSQGLQGGLQGELQDILQDPPVQMLHGQETNVTRIMAHNLPTGVKISRDAKQCMCQIASEITGFVTMEASAIARDKVANGVRPNIHYSYTYYIYTLTTSHTHTDERVCMYPQWLHSTYRRAASPRLPSAWTSACAPSRTLASRGSCPPSSTGCRRPTPHARPAAAGTVCMTRACSLWAPRRTSARALVAGARGREGMHATGPTARAVAPLGVWYTPCGYGVPVRLQWGDDTHSQ